MSTYSYDPMLPDKNKIKIAEPPTPLNQQITAAQLKKMYDPKKYIDITPANNQSYAKSLGNNSSYITPETMPETTFRSTPTNSLYSTGKMVSGNQPFKQATTTTQANTSQTNANPNSLRAYGGQKGLNISYDGVSDMVSVTNPNTGATVQFKSGEGGQYGLSGDTENTITDYAKFNSVFGLGDTTYGIKDPTNRADNVYSQFESQKVQVADIYRNLIRAGQLAQNNIIKDAPNQYKDIERAAANQKAADTMASRENLANQGIGSSGAAVNTSTQIGNNYATQLSNVDIQRQQLINNAEQEIARLTTEGKLQEAQALYDLSLKQIDAVSAEQARYDNSALQVAQLRQGVKEFDITRADNQKQLAVTNDLDYKRYGLTEKEVNAGIENDNRTYGLAVNQEGRAIWEQEGVASEATAKKYGIPVGAVTANYKFALKADGRADAELVLQKDANNREWWVVKDASNRGWKSLDIDQQNSNTNTYDIYNNKIPTGSDKPAITPSDMAADLKKNYTTIDPDSGNEILDKKGVLSALRSMSGKSYSEQYISDMAMSIGLTKDDIDGYNKIFVDLINVWNRNSSAADFENIVTKAIEDGEITPEDLNRWNELYK